MRLERFGLRQRFALFFAALGLGGCAIFGSALWFAFVRSEGPIDGYIIAGVIAGLGLLGLSTWIGLLFDENVAKPILALSSDLHSRASAGVSTEIDSQPARYLGALAPAAQAIHGALEEARENQARAIAEKTARMARDKALLETLVRDLAQGIVVISSEGKILLYNQTAIQILGDLGLGRPLDRFLRLQPVRDAAVRLDATKAADSESFLAATADGRRLLSGAVTTVRAEAEHVGHVLTFRDATEDLRTHGAFDALFREVLDKTRRPAMAISAILDVFDTGDTLEPQQLSRFTVAVREELRALSAELTHVADQHDRISAPHWPVRPTAVSDVFASLAVQHPTIQTMSTDVVVACDALAITTLLGRVLAELSNQDTAEDIGVSVEIGNAEIRLVLSWSGAPFPQATLEAICDAPLSLDYGSYTGRDALDAHRTDIWIAEGQRIVLPLPTAKAEAKSARRDRPDFYDFAASKPDGTAARLEDLTFVVFDTETTGLDAERDDVVQIAGVRIVQGRRIEGEVFDHLVSPNRTIPASSTEIHGITDAMVADAPDFHTVAAAFANFCDGAVLVAHNAPFDMAFLERIEAQGGPRFDHPVLCTARLSAAIDGHKMDHTLDALVETYGVSLSEERRHTALGDAEATAEIFLGLLGNLRSRGLLDLQDVVAFQEGR